MAMNKRPKWFRDRWHRCGVTLLLSATGCVLCHPIARWTRLVSAPAIVWDRRWVHRARGDGYYVPLKNFLPVGHLNSSLMRGSWPTTQTAGFTLAFYPFPRSWSACPTHRQTDYDVSSIYLDLQFWLTPTGGTSSIGSIDSPLSSSTTPSLVHSRFKTFLFCKSFLPKSSFSSPGLTPRTVYRYFWAYPFFSSFF